MYTRSLLNYGKFQIRIAVLTLIVVGMLLGAYLILVPSADHVWKARPQDESFPRKVVDGVVLMVIVGVLVVYPICQIFDGLGHIRHARELEDQYGIYDPVTRTLTRRDGSIISTAEMRADAYDRQKADYQVMMEEKERKDAGQKK